MHNLTEADAAKDKKFFIRYSQSFSTNTKIKPKASFAQVSKRYQVRNYLASETDVPIYDSSMMENSVNLEKKPIRTERIRKKESLRAQTKLIGSKLQMIPSHRAQNFSAVSDFKEEKDFPRIPIEYNDQKINGCMADYLRVKVIYRGYAPKNTYYFLKSLSISPINQKSNKPGEYQLQFNSRFQSGNLGAVGKKGPKQYWLFMREDTNTFGLRQWFYFSVINRKPGKYRFRIYKYKGMKPFVRNDSTQPQWRQAGENVKYQIEQQTKHNYLEFQYEFEESNMKTQFATQPPYTYTMLKQYIKSLEGYSGIEVSKVGESLAGLDIPLIKITEPKKNAQKSAIIIIARTHPSEVASNFALQGFIERLMQLPHLSKIFDFYIIPMINPDGVFFGNHRTGVMGQDLNRNFNCYDDQIFPEIRCVHKLIEYVKSKQKVEYLFDLHGHSAKRNIFVFGNKTQIGSKAFAYTHILPKLFSEQINSFKYNYCVFKEMRNKKNTARVHLSRKYNIQALTIEESYGMLDVGPIGISNWRNFGAAMADALVEYHKIYHKGRQIAMLEYLSDEIQYQKEIIQQRIKRKLKKLELSKVQNSQVQEIQQSKNYLTSSIDLKKSESKPLHRIKTKQVEEEKEKKNITQISDDTIVEEEQLSSGDEDLENNEEGLELLRKQMIKIGCLKDGPKRQAFSVPEKNLEMKGFYHPIIHEQKSSMAPRIIKFNMKRKDDWGHNFHKQSQNRPKRKSLNISERTQRQSVELPYLVRK